MMVLVRKIQILLPVEDGHIVCSRSDVVANPSGDGLVGRGHFISRQALEAEPLVDRGGVFGGEEFPFGIRPAILCGTRHVERPRRDQCHQQVLVDKPHAQAPIAPHSSAAGCV